MNTQPSYQPLVSVVITTYNHVRYIREAIESVRAQQYPAVEIIVVDDGSTDETASLVGALAGVTYVHQSNKGLPAARNTGIDHCRGAYIVFLDADDWLLPNALAVNAAILSSDKALAFVAGAHQFYDERTRDVRPVVKDPGEDYYCSLLEGNFIGMHAAVMYQRWVFDEFRFDPALANCEDFDLYLQVVRKYPMKYHKEILAVYRIHGANMSGDSMKMLEGAYRVYDKHRASIRSPKELACLEKGRLNFCEFYMTALENSLYTRLYHTGESIGLEELFYLKRQSPGIYARFRKTSFVHILSNPACCRLTGWWRLVPRQLLFRII